MATNIEKMTVETLTQELIQETVDVNVLNLAKIAHRTAFAQAIKTRPTLLAKIKGSNCEHFLTFAIDENPDNFVYLKKEQYTDSLAQKFLSKRLAPVLPIKNAADTTPKSTKLSVQKSLDEKLVFVCLYTAPEGQELYYYDNELQVPTCVRSSLKVTLKLNDALAFIERLDTHITQLGEKKIKTFLADTIVAKYKAYFNEYLKQNKVGYYTLCANCENLEKEIKDELQKIFKPYGIEVKQFVIKKLAIPKDVQYRIEDLAFQIRQQRANIDAEVEFAKKSLENYEAKLAVQQKYPETAHSLTEYEKDLALKRYLVKNGRLSEEEIDHSIKLSQAQEVIDKAIEKKADIVPEIPTKRNAFRNGFIGWFIFFLLVSCCFFAASPSAGCAALAVTVFLFFVIGIASFSSLKDEKMQIPEDEEDIQDITTTQSNSQS